MDATLRRVVKQAMLRESVRRAAVESPLTCTPCPNSNPVITITYHSRAFSAPPPPARPPPLPETEKVNAVKNEEASQVSRLEEEIRALKQKLLQQQQLQQQQQQEQTAASAFSPALPAGGGGGGGLGVGEAGGVHDVAGGGGGGGGSGGEGGRSNDDGDGGGDRLVWGLSNAVGRQSGENSLPGVVVVT